MSQRTDADIGVTGLAVMGRNLARNLARHGLVVALHNRSPARHPQPGRGARRRGSLRAERVDGGFRRVSLERPRAVIDHGARPAAPPTR